MTCSKSQVEISNFYGCFHNALQCLQKNVWRAMSSPNLKIFDYLVFKTILTWELIRDGLFLLVAGKRMILRQLVKSSPVFFNFGYSIDEIILAWEPQRDGWQGGDLENLENFILTFLPPIFLGVSIYVEGPTFHQGTSKLTVTVTVTGVP